MNWDEAIKQSKKGTAFRRVETDRYRITFVRYSDGSCFKLVAFKDTGKVNYDLSRPAEKKDIEGYSDWEPSI